MPECDVLIRGAMIVDGSGTPPVRADVAVSGERIQAIGQLQEYTSAQTITAAGYVLAPGFIDTHTHDDTSVVRTPEMLPKLSQGITTVIVGNCGISAAPAQLAHGLPDPMNLLGGPETFCYPTFEGYVHAVNRARPAVNVAALVGHTTLRNNQMDSLDRTAGSAEIEGMCTQLKEALDQGALGLSTGLAYLSAFSASGGEVASLVECLAGTRAIYTTHLRNEGHAVLPAMQEAFDVARRHGVPVVISHMKCAGIDNWGRSDEVLELLEAAARDQETGCDCYPYAASSSTLDLRQVDERVNITITWSAPHPEMAGRTLAEIAQTWNMPQVGAARRLQPAGAIYHSMSEDDVRAILKHPRTMIGSDGLPNDPRPHPRLWGTFPRVLGHYSRDHGLFSLPEAVRKMTGLPAARFGISDRGLIREGHYADLVLFDAETVSDTATFDDPIRPAQGILSVWVNGVLSYRDQAATGRRVGRFLPRDDRSWSHDMRSRNEERRG